MSYSNIRTLREQIKLASAQLADTPMNVPQMMSIHSKTIHNLTFELALEIAKYGNHLYSIDDLKEGERFDITTKDYDKVYVTRENNEYIIYGVDLDGNTEFLGKHNTFDIAREKVLAIENIQF
jgi:hypothetical protein